MADVESACSRFRADSELQRIQSQQSDGVRISPLLRELITASLDAARWTDGAVDPTMGRQIRALGYDRNLCELPVSQPGQGGLTVHPLAERAPRWQQIELSGRTFRAPEDVELDLGASAKAFTADLIAAEINAELEVGVMVSLGGDIATAGPAPDGGWQILVQDLETDPAQLIRLAAGSAVATSSTQKRRWSHAGEAMHHILDPRSGIPVQRSWRSATVAESSCLRANALSTAALVKRASAVTWLAQQSVAARLIDDQGRVHLVASWPEANASAEVKSHG